jgi:carboxypeptidase C (cathepsin A)
MNHSSIKGCVIALVVVWSTATVAQAQGSPAGALASVCQADVKGDKKDEWMREPSSRSSVTQHRLSAGGKSIEYSATAGLLVIRDNEDKPIANLSYVAYTRRDVTDIGARPILFAFNGGPGSSSLWLHHATGSVSRCRE